MTSARVRAAIVTPSVPPESSGQTIMLYQLLTSWDASRYCFITHSNYTEQGAMASERLPGTIHRIPIWRKIEAHELPAAGEREEEIRGWTRASLEADYRAEHIAQRAAEDGCTVIIATTGDLHDFPAARRAADRLGLPFVPYIFDSYVNQWQGSPIAVRFEREALPGAALTIVPNEFTAAEYEKKYGVPTAIVRNPVALDQIDAAASIATVADATAAAATAATSIADGAATPTFAPGLKHLLFTGSIYAANAGALRNIALAIDRLGRDDVRLHLFSEQIGRLEELGIVGPHVLPHDHVPHREVAALQRQADVLILPLGFDAGLHEVLLTSAPGKAGEYLATGRPIFAHVPPRSWVSWYFKEHRCGIVVDRDDVAAVATGLTEILTLRADTFRAAARRCAEEFALSRVAPRFETLIEEVALLAQPRTV